MPTYDYVCRKCGHRFENFQSMTSDALKRCPKCKRDALERLIGAGAGILFKGSGFYETDYKRAASKADAPQADGGKPEAGKSEPGTTGAPKADAPKPSKDAGKPPPSGGGAAKDGAPKGPAKPA